MSDESNLGRLPDLIIKLNSSIRRCEIIDKSGLIIATASRKKLQPLITDEAHYKHMLQAAIRHFTTQSWARAFGEKFYTVNRYEKIIVANITFTNNHLLFVSFDSGADDFDEIILKKIRPRIEMFFVSG
jgi:hypothetical protein